MIPHMMLFPHDLLRFELLAAVDQDLEEPGFEADSLKGDAMTVERRTRGQLLDLCRLAGRERIEDLFDRRFAEVKEIGLLLVQIFSDGRLLSRVLGAHLR